MKDIMIRATGANDQIRVFVAQTTHTVEEARKRHSLLPTSADALGRVLTATALMGMTLKHEDDTVTLRVMGDGPLGAIVAVGNNRSEVRGYVQNPNIYMPASQHGKYAFANAVGMGALHVTMDMGLKEPYTGSIPLVSGEISGDISEYYMSSEQTPSACGLAVMVDRDGTVSQAGGFLIQLLPGTDEQVAIQLEKNLEAMGGVSGLLDEGTTPQEMLKTLLKGFDWAIHREQPVRYQCNCSREKLEELLRSLGRGELEDILETQGQAEVSCHFCGDVYYFLKDDLEQLLEELDKGETH